MIDWIFKSLPTRRMVILLARRLVYAGYDIEDSIALLREDIQYIQDHKNLKDNLGG